MSKISDKRSLDHFIVSVLDADAAGNNYKRLGYNVLPLMRHIELGTCNRIVQFASTYIELIGDLDKAVAVHGNRMLKRFDIGEGLSLVSLTSSDLEADSQYLEEAGLSPDPIISARRKIDMPNGQKDETDSSCFYVWRENKEYLSLFYSAHYRPETIFIPGYFDNHPNSAKAITEITYVSKAPADDVGYFSTMFRSEPAKVEEDCIRFDTPRGETLKIVTQDKLEVIYPNVDWSDSDRLAGFPVGFDVRVKSLKQCARVLSENSVGYQLQNAAVIVDPAQCNGVLYKFHE